MGFLINVLGNLLINFLGLMFMFMVGVKFLRVFPMGPSLFTHLFVLGFSIFFSGQGDFCLGGRIGLLGGLFFG
jgi:hypothetical protein